MKNPVYLMMVFFLLINYIKNKRKITPIIALFGPLVLILFFIPILYSNIKISQEYLEVNLFVLLIWVIIEIIFNTLKKVKRKSEDTKIFNFGIFYKIGISVVIFLILLQLKTGLQYGFLSIKGNQNGIISHLYNLTAPFFLALFISSIENRKRLIQVLMVISIGLVALGPKLEVFILIIPCFLYFYEKKKKSIWVLLILFLFSIIIFYIFYFMLFYIKEGLSMSEFHRELLEYYKIYLFSPIIIGDELLKIETNTQGKEVVFSWFYNTLNMLKGNKMVLDPALKFITVNGVKSNVGGLVSETIYNLGYHYGVIYLIVLGIISYFVEFLYSIEKNWIFLSYYLRGVLVLGFFNNTFSVLTYVEKFLGCFFIISIILFLGKVQKINKGEKNDIYNTS